MKADEANKDKDVEADATFGKWLMLPFAIINFGISMGLPVSLSIMFLDWQETFQVNRAHTAGIHSTCTGFLLGGAVIPGFLMKKFGARRVILIGSIMASFGFLISMFATSTEYLIVTVGIVGGLGCCFIQIATIPCVTAVFSKYLGLIISSCTICSALYGVLFPYVYSYLVDQYSWRWVFGILACISLNTCVSGMIITSLTYRKPELSLSLIIEDSLTAPINGSDEFDGEVEEGDQNGNRELSNLVSETSISNQSSVAKGAEKDVSSIFQDSKSKTHTTEHNCLRNIFERVKNSDWKFLADVVFILFILHSVLCVACIFSFPLLITEFSKNRGFDKSTGIFFFSLIFFMSIFGRISSGLLNLSPMFHSIVLYTCFSMVNGIAMIFLSFTQDYTLTVVCLSVYGVCLGAVIGLQMKCVLDIHSVNSRSYPLALGVCITSEGIADFVIPIIIGYSVDTTDSYTLILIVMGCVCIAVSIVLGLGFRFLNKQKV